MREVVESPSAHLLLQPACQTVTASSPLSSTGHRFATVGTTRLRSSQHALITHSFRPRTSGTELASLPDEAAKMVAIMQNLKFALRLLRKSPGFALVAILIMALGIGANTAIFSVVHAVLLEPLPFRDADRLVQIWHTPPQKSFPGMTTFAVSAANFLDWQKQNHVFDQMALYSGAQFDITGAGKPEAIMAGTVSPSFFLSSGFSRFMGASSCSKKIAPAETTKSSSATSSGRPNYASDPNDPPKHGVLREVERARFVRHGCSKANS
jgi:hypothetical protein